MVRPMAEPHRRPAFLHPASLRMPDLNSILLVGLLAILWIAGGASRPDVPGQLIVRTAAWACIIIAVLAGARPDWRKTRPVWVILLAAILLVAVQLVPLPPGIWQSLPGRQTFVEIAVLTGQPQPWRPLAIVPDAAMNALASLVVPLAVLLMASGAAAKERTWLLGALLTLVTISALLGVLQFSGASLNNPFVNHSVGEVSGNFANRNHFSLFLGIGCLLAPVWAFIDSGRPGWRAPVALALVLLFALVVLGSGSRAGILLALVGAIIGFILVQKGLRRSLARGPRWLFPAIIAGIVAVFAIFILISVVANRAIAVDRIIEMRTGEDMRTRGLPIVLQMIGIYFPLGSGFGGFDPLFRMHEPFSLLKPTYFNHAHNDFAEIALDGGLPGLLVLALALGWWLIASVRVWRAPNPGHVILLARVGSAVLSLVMVASIVDYPGRTPLVMATIVLAAIWLADGARAASATLPRQNHHL